MDQAVEAEFVVEEVTGKIDPSRAAFLAIRMEEIETADDFKAVTALFLSSGKATGWGKDLTPAQARSLAVVARTTGLSPLSGEIIMLGGSVYVTEAGVMRKANEHPAYDGYELVPLPADERQDWGVEPDEFAFKCLVYRKDRKYPTIGVGRASKKNVQMSTMKDLWLPELAQKRAVERGHSRAFPLGLALYDEAAMAPKVVGTATVQDVPSDTVAAVVKDLGWTFARLDLETKGLSEQEKIAFLNTELAKKRAAAPTTHGRGGLAGTGTLDAAAAPPSENELSPANLKMSKGQQGKLFATLSELGITGKPERIAWALEKGVTVASFSELSEEQANILITAATDQVEATEAANRG